MTVLGSAGRDHSRVIPSPRGPSTEERVRQGPRPSGSTGKVVELFAGVGGFRLGLEAAGWEVIWANQWEPSTKTQHAFDCYVSHFDTGVHVNEDINVVLDQIAAGEREPIPDHDLLVGGFPCQDYSVAKTLNQAHGIEGKKGVLWWSIYRILAEKKRPRLVFLENVDRLLKSPATQRGRDFAIILACLSDLGYLVEWRVVNAADYGFPQRRRRVFIVAHRSRRRGTRLGRTDPVAARRRCPGFSAPDPSRGCQRCRARRCERSDVGARRDIQRRSRRSSDGVVTRRPFRVGRRDVEPEGVDTRR